MYEKCLKDFLEVWLEKYPPTDVAHALQMMGESPIAKSLYVNRQVAIYKMNW